MSHKWLSCWNWNIFFTRHIKSVNSATGDRAAFTDSRTMVSYQVGIKSVVFLSSLKTICMAASCSRIREIILCCDPHLVGQSVTNVWWGSPFAICASVRLFLFFQLCAKCCTTFLQTPTALVILSSSFMALVTPKFRLWPKQERWLHPNFVMAATMFDPLSVVIHICCSEFKRQDSIILSSASATVCWFLYGLWQIKHLQTMIF